MNRLDSLRCRAAEQAPPIAEEPVAIYSGPNNVTINTATIDRLLATEFGIPPGSATKSMCVEFTQIPGGAKANLSDSPIVVTLDEGEQRTCFPHIQIGVKRDGAVPNSANKSLLHELRHLMQPDDTLAYNQPSRVRQVQRASLAIGTLLLGESALAACADANYSSLALVGWSALALLGGTSKYGAKRLLEALSYQEYQASRFEASQNKRWQVITVN